MLCAYGKKNQYVDEMQQKCNDNEKNVKRYQKNGWLFHGDLLL